MIRTNIQKNEKRKASTRIWLFKVHTIRMHHPIIPFGCIPVFLCPMLDAHESWPHKSFAQLFPSLNKLSLLSIPYHSSLILPWSYFSSVSLILLFLPTILLSLLLYLHPHFFLFIILFNIYYPVFFFPSIHPSSVAPHSVSPYSQWTKHYRYIYHTTGFNPTYCLKTKYCMRQSVAVAVTVTAGCNKQKFVFNNGLLELQPTVMLQFCNITAGCNFNS